MEANLLKMEEEKRKAEIEERKNKEVFCYYKYFIWYIYKNNLWFFLFKVERLIFIVQFII